MTDLGWTIARPCGCIVGGIYTPGIPDARTAWRTFHRYAPAIGDAWARAGWTIRRRTPTDRSRDCRHDTDPRGDRP